MDCPALEINCGPNTILVPRNKNWKVSNQCIASLIPFPGLYRGLQKTYQHSYGSPMGPNSLCHPIMFGVVLDFKEWAKFPILAVFFSQYKETAINGLRENCNECCISGLVRFSSMSVLKAFLKIVFYFILLLVCLQCPNGAITPPEQQASLVQHSTDNTVQHLELAPNLDLF